MALPPQWLKARDVFAMRAHFGFAHYLAGKAGALPGPGASLARVFQSRLGERSDASARAFDAAHGLDTFDRKDVPVRAGVTIEELAWGYGPVNPDFFREILRSIPEPLARYAFVDVGAGKGAALLLASEFGFRRLVGVELSEELVAIGRRNVARYVASTGRRCDPEWVVGDFFAWNPPEEDLLFFFNNPFPAELSVDAIRTVEAFAQSSTARVLLVYRKTPRAVADELRRSSVFRPVRLAPYWCVYGSEGASSLEARGPRA